MNARSGSIARIEATLGRTVEIVVAVLTAIEVIVLFAGVVSRYVFHEPLVWSDELASILFLWLAMLGAVVAFRRSEHMRMAMMVNRASPGLRSFFEAIAMATALLAGEPLPISRVRRAGLALLALCLVTGAARLALVPHWPAGF